MGSENKFIDTKCRCRIKAVVVSLIVFPFLFVSTLHYARQFADDSMLKRLRQNYGIKAEKRAIALNNLVSRLQGQSVNEKLTQVNRFFNSFPYKEDSEQWGVKDYWASPEEFLGVNSGDCEDYVIAKYFVLRSLGIADEHLYLTYVKAVRQNAAHMVLSYFETPGSVPRILDNYEARILPATRRKDLLPVYSFNAKSLFLTNPSAGLGRSLPTDKIKNSKWEKLLSDMKRANQ